MKGKYASYARRQCVAQSNSLQTRPASETFWGYIYRKQFKYIFTGNILRIHYRKQFKDTLQETVWGYIYMKQFEDTFPGNSLHETVWVFISRKQFKYTFTGNSFGIHLHERVWWYIYRKQYDEIFAGNSLMIHPKEKDYGYIGRKQFYDTHTGNSLFWGNIEKKNTMEKRLLQLNRILCRPACLPRKAEDKRSSSPPAALVYKAKHCITEEAK